jgi:single-stranded-DNA-specific exonuclease
LHDPALLPDYRVAADAILGAKERGELIFVHGDYDVDGVTSAAIFDRFLKKIGCNVKTHVPHRMKEGYGIHSSAVDAAIAEGAKLFLTCDCGSGALEQIKKAREAGMTVVVTDHHTVGEEHPDAHAFINPHRQDAAYPFRELSGAGVVFKLCAGLTQELGFELSHYYRAYLDLACLGTVADVMPLVGENRIIAKHGFIQLAQTKKPGLRALKAVAEMDPEKAVTNYHIGFVLGPRLNATGRVDDAAISLQLLLEQDEGQAKMLAAKVDQLNRERKAEQDRIVEEAIAYCEETGAANRWVVLACKEGWHSGVVGIVASRLVETYYRPSFVMSLDPTTGIVKGSARSIANFHLAQAIWSHPDLFLSGGGHAMAAGCSFHADRIEEVRDALDSYARNVLTEEDLVPSKVVDIELESGELNARVFEQMEQLQPFGVANPEPVFVARGATIIELKPCRNPVHINLLVRMGEAPAQKAIAFNLGEALAQYESGVRMDLIFKPEMNEWRGSRSLQWKVQDYSEPA